MKTATLILCLFCTPLPSLWAQVEMPDENYAEEEFGPEQRDTEQKQKQDKKEVISVECKCPENTIQEEAESTINGLFPEDSIFVISPEPERPPSQAEQAPKEENDSIPGYDLKEPRGYSDDSYRPIPVE